MDLRHLEWLIGERVPDPEMTVYEVWPYTAPQADRVIGRLCGLAGLDLAQAGDDPARAERVRQAFGSSSTPHAPDRPCSICRRSSARSEDRRGATCSRSCVTTAAGSPPRSATRAPASRCAGHCMVSAWQRAPVAAGCITCATTTGCCAGRSTGRWRPGCCNETPAAPTSSTVWCSSRAWPAPGSCLAGRPLGRSLTAEQRPTGPGLRLVRLCLEPLDPLVTDDAIAWAIRRAQTHFW
jgi:hypothetical protein